MSRRTLTGLYRQLVTLWPCPTRRLTLLSKAPRARTLRGVSDTAVPDAAGSPPRTIVWTWYALLVAAAASALTSLALFGARTWLEDTYRKGINDSTRTAEQKTKDLANLSHTVSNVITFQLIFGALGTVILVFLAVRLKQGKHWTRWGILGAFVLMSLSGYSLIGLSGLLGVGSDAPLVFKVPSFVGAVSFIAAVILVNLRTSTEWLNRGRPQRTAAGGPGLRGLLGPRPPRRGAEGATPAPSRGNSGATKSATTRPGSAASNGAAKGGAATSKNGAAGAKGKARVATPGEQQAAKPAAAKSRGGGKAKGR